MNLINVLSVWILLNSILLVHTLKASPWMPQLPMKTSLQCSAIKKNEVESNGYYESQVPSEALKENEPAINGGEVKRYLCQFINQYHHVKSY